MISKKFFKLFQPHDSKTGLFCAGEATLAILPVVLFCVLGYQSYQNAQRITAYQTSNFTLRHTSKLILSLALVVVSLTFAVVYPIRNSTFALETELIWILDTIIWLINLYLLRVEYKKIGSTSSYLRFAWIAALLCHAFLVVMNDIKAHEDSTFTDFDLEIIWFLYLALVAVLVIVGYVFAEDFTHDPLNDSFTAFAQGESTVKFDEQSLLLLHSAKRASISSSSEVVNAATTTNILPKNVEKAHDNSPKKQKAIDIPAEKPQEEFKMAQAEEPKGPKKGTGEYFKENLSQMEKIEVSGWETMLRGERNTIMYVIEFDINRQKFTAKRSFSEFGFFMAEMAKKYPAINFPERPVRTNMDEDEKELKERAAIFDKFLNICLKNELFTARFAQFLSPQSEVPIFGKAPRKPKKPVQVDKEDRDLSSKDDAEVSFYAESEASSYQSTHNRANTLLGDSIIPDYAATERKQIMPTKKESKKKDEKFYTVEALAAFFQGAKKDTYYKFRIKEGVSGDITEISKRYSEFKLLDENLREFYKKDAVSLPALPYRGHLSFMISKRDTRVIEYRKVALKTYLQTLLNDKIIQGAAYDDKMIANIELKSLDFDDENFSPVFSRATQETFLEPSQRYKMDVSEVLKPAKGLTFDQFLDRYVAVKPNHTFWREFTWEKFFSGFGVGYVLLRELPLRNFYARVLVMYIFAAKFLDHMKSPFPSLLIPQGQVLGAKDRWHHWDVRCYDIAWRATKFLELPSVGNKVPESKIWYGKQPGHMLHSDMKWAGHLYGHAFRSTVEAYWDGTMNMPIHRLADPKHKDSYMLRYH